MNYCAVIRLNNIPYKLWLTCLWLWIGIIESSGQLIEEPQIAALMDRWKAYNLEHKEDIPGWRIQILATVDRRQLETVRRRFERLYPDFPVLFVHNEPFYHLKVGAFLTTLKAQAFQKKMQQEYPQAILVTDRLKVEELLLYDQ